MPNNINRRNAFSSRLKFTNTGKNRIGLLDIKDKETREVLGKEPQKDFTKQEIINKLKDYKLITDNNDIQLRLWYRYINRDDGVLRGGGFLIKHTDKFLALKNVSLNFTFSIQKEDVILFEKKKKSNLKDILPEFKDLFFEFKEKTGNVFILADQTGKSFHQGNSIRQLVNNTPNASMNGVGKAFRKKNDKYKTFFLFKMNNDDTIRFKIRYENTTIEERKEDEEEIDIDKDVLQVINRFY